jgi:hypothetical protein
VFSKNAPTALLRDASISYSLAEAACPLTLVSQLGCSLKGSNRQ